MMLRVFSLIAMLLGAAPASAHEYLVGTLAIVHPHARPTAPDTIVTGGFMELFNGSDTPESLLAVRSGIADVSFFDPAADDGNGARLATAIDLPPGRSVFLEPDKLQVRFAGLQEPLRIGDKFLVTLVFEQAGAVTVEFWVEGVASEIVPVIATPAPSDISRDTDDAAIADHILDTFGPDTQVTAVASSGSAAVAGWIAGKDAGRAFLRRTDDTWHIVLLSGPSLITSAGIRAQGTLPRTATDLLEKIRMAEAGLPAETLARLDGFKGTLVITPP